MKNLRKIKLLFFQRRKLLKRVARRGRTRNRKTWKRKFVKSEYKLNVSDNRKQSAKERKSKSERTWMKSDVKNNRNHTK